jgi:CRISPR-associated protein Cas2
MFVLVTYDINTETAAGRRRLAHVAKICKKHGQRVQNSVFECILDPVQLLKMKSQVEKFVDLKKDSIRYYNLGSSWERKVEHIGTKTSYDPEGFLAV